MINLLKTILFIVFPFIATASEIKRLYNIYIGVVTGFLSFVFLVILIIPQSDDTTTNYNLIQEKNDLIFEMSRELERQLTVANVIDNRLKSEKYNNVLNIINIIYNIDENTKILKTETGKQIFSFYDGSMLIIYKNGKKFIKSEVKYND